MFTGVHVASITKVPELGGSLLSSSLLFLFFYY